MGSGCALMCAASAACVCPQHKSQCVRAPKPDIYMYRGGVEKAYAVELCRMRSYRS
jgi:hypothetical protein